MADVEIPQIELSKGNTSHSSTKTGAFYRPELDALRCLAFLAVFLCHALPVNPFIHGAPSRTRLYLEDIREAGNFGVCLFFFLSSFLITELLRREEEQTGSVHLKAFYVRRSLRIWPLYFVVVFTSTLSGLFIPQLHISLESCAAFVFFMSNWYMILHLGLGTPLNWLWSISVEEQFYITWPLVAKIGSMRAIGIGSVVCLPLSLLAIGVANSNARQPDVTIWLNSFVQFQFFAWGALLALQLAGRLPRFSSWMRCSLAGVGATCWLAASAYCLIKRSAESPSTLRLCLGYELVAIGCMCILLAVLGMSASFIPRPLIYLGKISYGLYVFHEIALTTVTFVRHHIERTYHGGSPTALLSIADRIASLFLTIVLAWLSYNIIEKPFLKVKARFAFVRSRVA